MKYAHLVCFTMLFLLNAGYAQSPDLLKAEGEIPKEFITPSTDKYKKQLTDLTDQKSKRRDKKNKKLFLLQSNFAIDDILQSGLVLFNDPATVYVNKVLENLPVSNTKLQRKSPRAYILNTSAVNAFATDQGIIFVTLGLLANLENEAQLAFILAHELAHVKHSHAIDKFIKSKDIDRDSRSKYNVDELSMDRSLFQKSLYSRTLEEEADADGLELFLKSDYDPQAILKTFKILYYSYLPFEDHPFDQTFFEDAHYRFPDEVWLEETRPIGAMEEDEEQEKRSSHPSGIKRMNKLQSKVEGKSSEGKKIFLLPESAFKTIQAKARYQIPFIELYREDFPSAIYTSFLLLQKYPDDLELKKLIGKALYMEAKYQRYEATNSDHERRRYNRKIAKASEGEVSQVYQLMTKLKSEELCVLAMKYNWPLYQQNKSDPELKHLIDDLFAEFAAHFDDLHSSFEQKAPPPPTTKSATPDTTQSEPSKPLSKIDKIEQQQKSKPKEYWRYAFVNEITNNDFTSAHEKGLEVQKEREEKEEYYMSREGEREYVKRQKKEQKKGKSLGISKVVVVNPFYLSLDDRKRDGTVQFIRSEEKQAAFRNSIKRLAKLSKLKTEVLDVTDLSTGEVDKFNDIAEINQYINQQIDHYDLTLTPGYNQNQIDAIAEKYGTEYFLWTGVVSLRQKSGSWGLVAASVIMPYFLPFTLTNAIKPNYDMMYYAILYDVTTGRRSILKMDYFDKRDSKAILHAHIYDVFHQIKSK